MAPSLPVLVGIAAIIFAIFAGTPSWDSEVMLVPLEKSRNDTLVAAPSAQGLTFVRNDETFDCSGEACHAWLYLPRVRLSPPPVVVMAHGIGAQKDFGLASYAEAFAGAGIAALVFDYRGFGGSSGQPRNNVNPWRHVADYKAAVAFARNGGIRGQVDSARIGLWGTSFAGGHVIVAAAQDSGNISAVVSQIPHLDGRAASKRSMAKRGLWGTLRMAHAALKDVGRRFMGLGSARIKIVGLEGELAYMPMSEEQRTLYYAKHPSIYLGNWTNAAPASGALMVGFYSPKNFVAQVRAPVMFIAAEHDELCPADAVREAADAAKHARLHVFAGGHFDAYQGETHRKLLEQTTAFLKGHLRN